MKRKLKFITLVLLLISLCSCGYFFGDYSDIPTPTSTSYSFASTSAHKNFEYISPLQKQHELSDLYEVGIPSKGDVNILVIPVQIGNHEFTNKELNDLELAFNGTSEETGFESVNSYYKKVSLNHLNLNADITPVFKAKQSRSYIEFLYNNGRYPEELILKDALEYFDDLINYKNYDYDYNGSIDGVYLIYSTPYIDTYDSIWWAWCSQYYGDGTKEKIDSVFPNFYVWASISFMYDEINNQELPVNAETYIHETGHMLGLDDYYDYNTLVGPSGGSGGGSMMDYNVGDFDPFSKIMMGWGSTIIYEGKNETINIKPAIGSNISILVPLRTFNNNYFNEYLLIIYYVPEGVNRIHKGYNGLFSESGVAIYHVNAVISSKEGHPNRMGIDEYGNAYYTTLFSYNNSDTEHRILSLVEKDLSNPISEEVNSDNNDLFYPGDSLVNFTNSQGELLETKITIDNISEECATITFLK